MNKILVLDFETTGLDPKIHEPIQVAAVILDRNLKEIAFFESKMRPLRPEVASPEALAVHGYTLEELAKAPDPRVVFRELANFARSYARRILVAGHNVGFDMGFLEEAEKAFGHTFPRFTGYFDTAATARAYLTNPGIIGNAKLSTVADRFGIKFQAHDALGDVRATAEIIRRMLPASPEEEELDI